ncbi:hypothetical protein [Cyanobacterium sp. uoEpiScrs1]|nr:hypothetical protein [Cyanobacterium sp. uoEpiScrs1]
MAQFVRDITLKKMGGVSIRFKDQQAVDFYQFQKYGYPIFL